MFGRATITFGIGPHSSSFCNSTTGFYETTGVKIRRSSAVIKVPPDAACFLK